MSPSWERELARWQHHVIHLLEGSFGLVFATICALAYVTAFHALPGILPLVFLDLSVLPWFIPDSISSSYGRHSLGRIALPLLLWACAIAYLAVYRLLPGIVPVTFLAIQTVCSLIVGVSRRKWHVPSWFALCKLSIHLIGGALLYTWVLYRLPLACALLLLAIPVVSTTRQLLESIGLVIWLRNVFMTLRPDEEQLRQLDKLVEAALVAIILELIAGATVKMVFGL